MESFNISRSILEFCIGSADRGLNPSKAEVDAVPMSDIDEATKVGNGWTDGRPWVSSTVCID